MGSFGLSRNVLRNCHSLLSKIWKERGSYLNCGGSLKSRFRNFCVWMRNVVGQSAAGIRKWLKNMCITKGLLRSWAIWDCVSKFCDYLRPLFIMNVVTSRSVWWIGVNIFLKRPLDLSSWKDNMRMKLWRRDVARTGWRWCALANSVVAKLIVWALLPKYRAVPALRMIT